MAKKTAIDKISEDKDIKIVDMLPEGIKWAPAGSSMVVSTPKEVHALMARVPKAKLITTDTLREKLSDKYNTDITCPLSTGIFVSIASAASEEMKALGIDDRIPWWRTLKNDGSLNPKAPGGPEAQMTYLKEEGYSFTKRGKKIRVENYEDYLLEAKTL